MFLCFHEMNLLIRFVVYCALTYMAFKKMLQHVLKTYKINAVTANNCFLQRCFSLGLQGLPPYLYARRCFTSLYRHHSFVNTFSFVAIWP